MREHNNYCDEHNSIASELVMEGPCGCSLLLAYTVTGTWSPASHCQYMALQEQAVALRMFYRRDICIPVFLALNKVKVGRYEDSDSKSGVGVSTQARQTAT